MKISKVAVWKASIGIPTEEWIIDIHDENGALIMKIFSDIEPEVTKT